MVFWVVAKWLLTGPNEKSPLSLMPQTLSISSNSDASLS